MVILAEPMLHKRRRTSTTTTTTAAAEKEKAHTIARQNTATAQMCLRVYEVLVLVALAHTFWY